MRVQIGEEEGGSGYGAFANSGSGMERASSDEKAASVVAHRYGRWKKVYVAAVIIPQRDKKRNKRRIA